MGHQRTREIANTFQAFAAEFSQNDYAINSDEFFEICKRFRLFVASIDNEKDFEDFYHSTYFINYREKFVPIIQHYMRAIETDEASRVQRTSIADGHYSFNDQLKSEYMKERFMAKMNDLRMVDFSQVKTVVMVGCGPLPETILFIAENFKVPRIIGLDSHAEAVQSCGKLINHIGWNNVSIKAIDGCQYDYAHADFVYVANFVPPKNDVLNRIALTAPEQVQIIIESPLLMGKILFEEVNPTNLHPLLRITNKQENRTPYFRHEILKIEKHPDPRSFA